MVYIRSIATWSFEIYSSLKLPIDTLFIMASAPDTESIPGYTIFREGDYDSVAAAAMLPQGTPHPLGTKTSYT